MIADEFKAVYKNEEGGLTKTFHIYLAKCARQLR